LENELIGNVSVRPIDYFLNPLEASQLSTSTIRRLAPCRSPSVFDISLSPTNLMSNALSWSLRLAGRSLPKSFFPTATVPISIGPKTSSPGRYRNKITMERRFAINSYHRGLMLPPRSSTRVSIRIGPPLRLYAGCLPPLGNTSSSTPNTNTRTSPTSAPISNSTSSALSLVCTSCQYALLAAPWPKPAQKARKSSESVDTCPTRRMIFALPL